MDPSADPANSFLASLERRSAFLENVISTCPEGIIANDTRGNIFLYNKSAEAIFGYTAEEAIGKLHAKLLYPPGGAKEGRDYVHSQQYGPHGHLVDFETEILRKNFRTMDTGFRHGGEEFLVLLPETPAEAAVIAAERLRKRFAAIPFLPHPDEEPRKVTLSIGVAEFRPGISIDDLVRSADRAMYAAKNAGRNRTVSHEHLVAQSNA